MKFLISLDAGPGPLNFWEGHADNIELAEQQALNHYPGQKIYDVALLKSAKLSFNSELGEHWACGTCGSDLANNPGYCSDCVQLLKGNKIWRWGKKVGLEEI